MFCSLRAILTRALRGSAWRAILANLFFENEYQIPRWSAWEVCLCERTFAIFTLDQDLLFEYWRSPAFAKSTTVHVLQSKSNLNQGSLVPLPKQNNLRRNSCQLRTLSYSRSRRNTPFSHAPVNPSDALWGPKNLLSPRVCLWYFLPYRTLQEWTKPSCYLVARRKFWKAPLRRRL